MTQTFDDDWIDDDIDRIGLFLEHQGFDDEGIDEYFLEHFGVQGMRWGVRRRGRVERTVTVGKGGGSTLDKVRVGWKANPIDLVRTLSFRKAAARKGARLVRRNQRMADHEARFFRDVTPTLFAFRYTDILPSVNSRTISRDDKRKNLKKMTNGAEFAIAISAVAGAIALRQLKKRGTQAVIKKLADM